ncbi:MAG TPA: transglycosylase family protein [Acidimicrobiales bacterium]
MSDRTDHPPSPDDGSIRGRSARRAVAGGVAGIALLVGPVLLANALVPGKSSGKDAVEAAGSETSIVALRRNATQRDQARANALMSMRTTTTLPPTTTTTAPPTTTTTEPPTTTTTEPPTTTAPPPTAPPSSGGGFGDPNDYATWDALAECESGGNWQANTGNGYYGGLQFSAETWHSVGGPGLPHEHSRETQIYYGQILQARAGWGQWPHCARELGLI